MAHYVGIDIGTSGVKAIVMTEDGAVVAQAHADLQISRPYPLWSEQNAEDYWTATRKALKQLRHQAPTAWKSARAIGLSGQMHGAVILGKDDKPLRPVILWNDGRSAPQAKMLYQHAPALTQRLGVMPMPGFTAPKLLWLRQHEPAVFETISCLLLPKDYVRLKLTGVRVTDMSDAAGTWLFDQSARQWSQEALDLIGMQATQMPELVEGSQISARLRPEIAAELGLPADIIVAGGGDDAATGGVGIGAVNDGDRFISLGTSAQYFIASRQFRPNITKLVHAFAHAIPDHWYQMGCMLNGASVFGFAARMLGKTDEQSFSNDIKAAYKGPSPLLMLPYLTGERTPYNDPHAKGVLFGLTPDIDALLVGQAAMEGVAFALADQAEALDDSKNQAQIAIIGGGTKSAIWPQIIANVLGRTIIRYEDADKGPSYGAALLAQIAATGAPPRQIIKAPPVRDSFEPDAALHAAYQPRLTQFRQLYQVLAPLFRSRATA